ncbi:MAG: acyltransferase [Pseudogulbenkiania sp.]|nr:acyltransferase [Pseudogulbenkiania sp.]
MLANAIFSYLQGAKININWADIKIIGLRGMLFRGTLSAGRGLWLETIGDDASIEFGNGVNMSDWVHIAAVRQLKIGNGVLIGSKVLITDHAHGRASHELTPELLSMPPNTRPIVSKGRVVIEDNVWIGDGAIILANVTIGEGAIIGANSVVTRDVEPFSVYAGTPARKLAR